MDFMLQLLFGEIGKNRPLATAIIVSVVLVAIYLLKLLIQYIVDGWKARRDELIAVLTADRSDLVEPSSPLGVRERLLQVKVK